MATVSSSWSAFEKSPKPEKTVVGLFFWGLLLEAVEATVWLLVAPLPGTDSLVLSWTALTVERICGLAVFGLLSWFIGNSHVLGTFSPLVLPSCSGWWPSCTDSVASAASPPTAFWLSLVADRISNPALEFCLTEAVIFRDELEEEEWRECTDEDLSERCEWLRDPGLLERFLGVRERPLLGLWA